MERLQNKHGFGARLCALLAQLRRPTHWVERGAAAAGACARCRHGMPGGAPPPCPCTRPAHTAAPCPMFAGLMAVSLGYFDTLMSASAASTSSELSDAELAHAGEHGSAGRFTRWRDGSYCRLQHEACQRARQCLPHSHLRLASPLPAIAPAAGISGGLVRLSVGLTGSQAQVTPWTKHRWARLPVGWARPARPLQGRVTLAVHELLQWPTSLNPCGPLPSNPGAAMGAAGRKLPACGGSAAVHQAGIQGAAGKALGRCSCSRPARAPCAADPQGSSSQAPLAPCVPLVGTGCWPAALLVGALGGLPTAARLAAAPVQLTRTAGGGLKRTPSWHSFGTTLDETDTEEEADGTSVVRAAGGRGAGRRCCRAATAAAAAAAAEASRLA